LYIGLAPFKLDRKATSPAWRKSDQLPDQIEMLRKYPNISGCIFFSSKSFSRDLIGFQDSLTKRLFKYAALTPPGNVDLTNRPDSPTQLKVSGRKVHWEAPLAKSTGSAPFHYLVYLNNPEENFDIKNPLKIVKYTEETTVEIQKNKAKKRRWFKLRVTTLDRNHLESEPTLPANIKL